VIDSATIEIAFLAPARTTMPSKVARKTKKAVTYREKSQAALDKEYRHCIAALALRLASEALGVLPTVRAVHLEGYERRVRPSDGHPQTACICAWVATREAIQGIDLEQAESETAFASLGGQMKWTKGAAVERQPTGSIRLE
jgi:hypothetical protein